MYVCCWPRTRARRASGLAARRTEERPLDQALGNRVRRNPLRRFSVAPATRHLVPGGCDWLLDERPIACAAQVKASVARPHLALDLGPMLRRRSLREDHSAI